MEVGDVALNSSGKVQGSITVLSLRARKSSPASLGTSDIQGGKVYSRLYSRRVLTRALPLDTLSISSIALTLSNSEIAEMSLGNGSAFMIFLKKENSGVYPVETGGMRDATAATGVREGCGGQENSSLLRRADRVVCSSLELAHTTTATAPPQTHCLSVQLPWF